MSDPVPAIAGLHHLSLLVSDLEHSSGWFERTLGASRIGRLDHHDQQGGLASVVLEVPGLGTFLQLRRWSESIPTLTDFQPFTMGVPDEQSLLAWVAHLDAIGVQHGGIGQRFAGRSVKFADPDGNELAVYLAED